MNNLFTIAIIVVVLIICVIGISIIQKREAARQALRLKISQFKYRANQAATILSNMAHLPIGKHTREVLTQYIIGNLAAVKQLTPNDSINNANLEKFQQSLNNLNIPTDNAPLEIPGDIEKLKQLINQLTTLAKFIRKLSSSALVNSNNASQAIRKLNFLIAESKILAYVKQAKVAIAQQHYHHAHQLLNTSQKMLNSIQKKNSRLTNIEADTQQLIESIPQDALTQAPTPLTENSQPAGGITAPEQPNDEDAGEEEHDDLFGPKKKW